MKITRYTTFLGILALVAMTSPARANDTGWYIGGGFGHRDLDVNIDDFDDGSITSGDVDTSEPAVMVALTMQSGKNIIDVCNAAKDRVREMQHVEQSLPPDIAVESVSDQSVNVEAKICDVVSNVIGAIVIVIIVVYLVVGFRSAAVMATNIPVVVLAAMALITLFDVPTSPYRQMMLRGS